MFDRFKELVKDIGLLLLIVATVIFVAVTIKELLPIEEVETPYRIVKEYPEERMRWSNLWEGKL